MRWLRVALLLGGLCMHSAGALECYRCQSNTQVECSEIFDTKTKHLHPTSCNDVFEARYCIKTTGMFEGEIGTQRFCSSRDHGNYCEYIRRPGDDREYRSCVYTCRGDACNGATWFQGPKYWYMLLPIAINWLLVASTTRC